MEAPQAERQDDVKNKEAAQEEVEAEEGSDQELIYEEEEEEDAGFSDDEIQELDGDEIKEAEALQQKPDDAAARRAELLKAVQQKKEALSKQS